jgi:hypothetical protein
MGFTRVVLGNIWSVTAIFLKIPFAIEYRTLSEFEFTQLTCVRSELFKLASKSPQDFFRKANKYPISGLANN